MITFCYSKLNLIFGGWSLDISRLKYFFLGGLNLKIELKNKGLEMKFMIGKDYSLDF